MADKEEDSRLTDVMLIWTKDRTKSLVSILHYFFIFVFPSLNHLLRNITKFNFEIHVKFISVDFRRKGEGEMETLG